MQNSIVVDGNAGMPPLVALVSVVASDIVQTAIFRHGNLVDGEQPGPFALKCLYSGGGFRTTFLCKTVFAKT